MHARNWKLDYRSTCSKLNWCPVSEASLRKFEAWGKADDVLVNSIHGMEPKVTLPSSRPAPVCYFAQVIFQYRVSTLRFVVHHRTYECRGVANSDAVIHVLEC